MVFIAMEYVGIYSRLTILVLCCAFLVCCGCKESGANRLQKTMDSRSRELKEIKAASNDPGDLVIPSAIHNALASTMVEQLASPRIAAVMVSNPDKKATLWVWWIENQATIDKIELRAAQQPTATIAITAQHLQEQQASSAHSVLFTSVSSCDWNSPEGKLILSGLADGTLEIGIVRNESVLNSTKSIFASRSVHVPVHPSYRPNANPTAAGQTK